MQFIHRFTLLSAQHQFLLCKANVLGDQNCIADSHTCFSLFRKSDHWPLRRITTQLWSQHFQPPSITNSSTVQPHNRFSELQPQQSYSWYPLSIPVRLECLQVLSYNVWFIFFLTQSYFNLPVHHPLSLNSKILCSHHSILSFLDKFLH